MNTDVLNAFNNGGDESKKNKNLYEHYDSLFQRQLKTNALLRELYHNYFNASKQKDKGIKRLQNKIKRLEEKLRLSDK